MNHSALSRIRRWGLGVAVVALLAAPAVGAAGVIPGGHYGDFEGDPSTAIIFGIAEKQGTRRVTDLYVSGVPVGCSTGDVLRLSETDLPGSPRIRHGRFHREVRHTGNVIALVFDGRLLKGGKARGTFRLRFVDGGGAVCYTGLLRWRAA